MESKQPKRVVERTCSSTERHFEMTVSDTECLKQAIAEYRETSWDDSSFEELPFEAQHAILRRAQEIKSRQHWQAVSGFIRTGAA
jgi:hypothetical protein